MYKLKDYEGLWIRFGERGKCSGFRVYVGP